MPARCRRNHGKPRDTPLSSDFTKYLAFPESPAYHRRMITKTQAIGLYGSVPKLAAALGYTRQAIYAWPDEGPIHEMPFRLLRFELRPDAFKENGEVRKQFATPPPLVGRRKNRDAPGRTET